MCIKCHDWKSDTHALRYGCKSKIVVRCRSTSPSMNHCGGSGVTEAPELLTSCEFKTV